MNTILLLEEQVILRCDESHQKGTTLSFSFIESDMPPHPQPITQRNKLTPQNRVKFPSLSLEFTTKSSRMCDVSDRVAYSLTALA